MRKLMVAAAAAVLLLTGCASGDEAPEATVEPEQEVVEEVTATPEEPAEADVVALGTAQKVGDWEITINSWNPNADDEVFAASGETDVPMEGGHFAILNVTMKYLGEGIGDNSEVEVDYIPDSAGSVSSLWTTFGTTPGENKLTYEELTTGGEITGDALYEIDADTTGVFYVYAPPAEEPVEFATE
ncbi:hypothetical protein K8P10_001975 [Leucobacter sp. Psy1]|uniref:hypothetical protein n=1 Tax=Leucobacter sp. Psy1 TaxID=2875729 RepID=UPI001CD5A05D|nr:hypothetical protein [Leucobacter sp. Psy1]UBH06464.1 hypothetical protein K8P10_001975 [Leucobacter sp. Psy1]